MPYNDPNITAVVNHDSINKFGDRLTTFVITYPRIILAEVNTHRMLSKSTASSRAIPIAKQVKKVRDNPFIPSWMGKAQRGMQAEGELEGDDLDEARHSWVMASENAADISELMDRQGVHKQIANRVIEPFSYVKTIISATDWDNFFWLRANPMAQPEFMVLAFKMLKAYIDSVPVSRDDHIPFGDLMEPGLVAEDRKKIAVARCARISYNNHDGETSPEKDIKFHDELLKNKHMSPFEHVATCGPMSRYFGSNFRGWIQYRKTIYGENKARVDYRELYKQKPSWINE